MNNLIPTLFYLWCLFCVVFVVGLAFLATLGAIITWIDDAREPIANKIARKKVRKAELEATLDQIRLIWWSRSDFAIRSSVNLTRLFNLTTFELEDINEYLKKHEEPDGKN